jgi:hypothetical protein
VSIQWLLSLVCSGDCVQAVNMGKSEVDFDKLNDTNYGTWASRKEMLLVLKDCIDVVRTGLNLESTVEAGQENQARALIGSHVGDMYLSPYSSSSSARNYLYRRIL